MDGFIERVKDRTNGRVEFQVSSFPELGLAGPDSLRLIEDRTMELAEIYSGYIGGDLPIIDVANLWGLYPDSATNFAVVERTGGPNSEAVQIYNEKAAPIIGVRVGADGQAEDIN